MNPEYTMGYMQAGPIKGNPWSAYRLMGLSRKHVFGQKIELVVYKDIQDMKYTPQFS